MHTEQQCPVPVEAGERLTNTVHMHRMTLTEDFNLGSITRIGVFFVKSRSHAADPCEGSDGVDQGQLGCARGRPLVCTLPLAPASHPGCAIHLAGFGCRTGAQVLNVGIHPESP